MTVRAKVHPRQDFWVLARITQADGTILPYTNATTPAVRVNAWVVNYPHATGRDANTGPYIIKSRALTNVTAATTTETSVALFSEFQKDAKWTEDSQGYNFAHYMDVDALAQDATAASSHSGAEVSNAPTLENWSSDNAKILLEYSITDAAWGTVILRAELQLLPSDSFGYTGL